MYLDFINMYFITVISFRICLTLWSAESKHLRKFSWKQQKLKPNSSKKFIYWNASTTNYIHHSMKRYDGWSNSCINICHGFLFITFSLPVIDVLKSF